MTADSEVKEKNPAELPTKPSAPDLPSEITEIFEFLCGNDRIVFKSQQIDDPELQRSEKMEIAREIYVKNRQTFFARFGGYMEERHLNNFSRLAIGGAASPPLKVDEHGEEMELMLQAYRRRMQTRKLDVKNRRYVTMQRLIAEGEYFSEQEMMKRAPELYQELVGQYLSEEEKKQRDGYDVKNTTFSGILMHTMRQQELNERLKEADKKNKSMEKQIEKLDDDNEAETSQSSMQEESSEESNAAPNSGTSDGKSNASENYDDEVPSSFRQQWGNFENEPVACSTSRNTLVHKSKVVKKQKSGGSKANFKMISAGERDLLRQEFLGLMHEQFLAGNDTEFDYSLVDDNSSLDDLRQLNQDKEDEYFEEDSGEDDNGEGVDGNRSNGLDALDRIDDTDESDDDLDVYMNHLSKHHSLQS